MPYYKSEGKRGIVRHYIVKPCKICGHGIAENRGGAYLCQMCKVKSKQRVCQICGVNICGPWSRKCSDCKYI